MEQTTGCPRLRIAVWTVVSVGAIYVAWIAAWLLKESLDKHTVWATTQMGGFVYWTAMKLLLWIVPSVWLIRVSGRRIRDVIGLSHLCCAILWGVSVGLTLALITTAGKALQHQPLFSRSLSWGFVTAVVIAPLFEEFMFRGAVLGALMQRYRFAVANVGTAALFLGLHLPGWYFQGRLWQNLTSLSGGAVAIFTIGLLFGLATHKGKSLVAGILAHSLSNLFS